MVCAYVCPPRGVRRTCDSSCHTSGLSGAASAASCKFEVEVEVAQDVPFQAELFTHIRTHTKAPQHAQMQGPAVAASTGAALGQHTPTDYL
jgi:hypothetical protein